jgi:hypothetical protein
MSTEEHLMRIAKLEAIPVRIPYKRVEASR